ncbi:MAG: peroxiredoxin, partial [Candidatus Eremiobacteraeota bacterium]|nr:peroxiredoxin [Candidatus Eremiobacteraeota bacterium]
MIARRSWYLAAGLLAVSALPAMASLSVGAKAPLFTLQASQGGNTFTFSLADA